MNLYGETSDEYPNVVVMLDAKTRVIAADIQWIVQRRTGDRWLSQLFFRTKEGLLFYTPKPYPAELLVLPDRFPEGGTEARGSLLQTTGGTPGLRPIPQLCHRPWHARAISLRRQAVDRERDRVKFCCLTRDLLFGQIRGCEKVVPQGPGY